jgi:flagellar motor switch protein FliG
MLARYKKQGGFEQLLLLIETSNDKKQQQFLQLIEAESPMTAAMIKSKMLTLDKIFSWDASFLGDITINVPSKILAILLKDRPENVIQNVIATFPHAKKQEVLAAVKEMTPSVGEYESARIKLIQTVRDLNKAGAIKIAKISPELDIKDLKVS